MKYNLVTRLRSACDQSLSLTIDNMQKLQTFRLIILNIYP